MITKTILYIAAIMVFIFVTTPSTEAVSNEIEVAAQDIAPATRAIASEPAATLEFQKLQAFSNAAFEAQALSPVKKHKGSPQ